MLKNVSMYNECDQSLPYLLKIVYLQIIYQGYVLSSTSKYPWYLST